MSFHLYEFENSSANKGAQFVPTEFQLTAERYCLCQCEESHRPSVITYNEIQRHIEF
jgi:hypothetical protein